MTRTFGDFIEQKDGYGEYLKIGFYPSSIPIQQRWRNNGLSADFLAAYLSTFFPGEDPESARRQLEIKDAINYVANELLENAIKFSYAPSHHAVSIEMFLEADVISLYATNSFDPATLEPFQQFIDRLLTEEPQELYLERLESNAEHEDENTSGLGLLTMLNDYGATLAWKFTHLGQDSGDLRVTTMVRLRI